MTKFNPHGKESLTYEESLGPAMKITEQDDADQYKLEYIAYIQKYLDKKPPRDGVTAESIANINIGYYAGYYSGETAERVYRLFKTSHPIFGGGYVSPAEAIAAGIKLATDD